MASATPTFVRECVPNITVRTLEDVCEVQMPKNGPVITNDVYSSCPPQNICSDFVDEDGDRSIKCVNTQKPGNIQLRTKPSDPEIGASVVQEAQISVTSFDIDVSVANDMIASVTANVLSRFLPPITLLTIV